MVQGDGGRTLRPRLFACRVAWLVLWLAGTGCAPVWHLHYDQAEKAADWIRGRCREGESNVLSLQMAP